jgi:hypothetical protein
LKTIYLLQKSARYGGTPKLLRAFESKRDAEDLVTIMGRADVEGFEIVELELETAQPHTPAPMQPRVPVTFAQWPDPGEKVA